MEFQDFFKALRRRRTLLFIVPMLAAAAAFLAVRWMPGAHKSRTRLATGLVAGDNNLIAASRSAELRVEDEFDNLIQMMLLKKTVTQVSYKAMLHDLAGGKPFREPSAEVEALSASQRAALATLLQEKQARREELQSTVPVEEAATELLESMKYDAASLAKNLNVYRVNNSDFIDADFTSPNPALSAFVLNTLATEFITYYKSGVTANRDKSVVFLGNLMGEKRRTLDSLTTALREYKVRNGILDVNEEARSLYGQLAEFETRRSNAQKDAIAYGAAANSIDRKFNTTDRGYVEGRVSSSNVDVSNTKDQLKAANDAYVQSNFDQKYVPIIDSLKSRLTTSIHASDDRYLNNPLSTKENLSEQKLSLETNREIARNSVSSYAGQVSSLNSRLNRLVPSEAAIQVLQASIGIAEQEYLDALKKYNDVSLTSNLDIPLRQVEQAVPTKAEPSKKWLIVAASGLLALLLCIGGIFAAFYFDRTARTPLQLANITGLPVLGQLNKVELRQVDMERLWDAESAHPSLRLFKERLRAVRFEVERELGDGKILAITSLHSGAGKTFFTISLAYAFSKASKRVLVIDGNFGDPDISRTLSTPNFMEDVLRRADGPALTEGAQNRLISLSHGTDGIRVPTGDREAVARNNSLITVVGNQGGDTSLVELNSRDAIIERLDLLKDMYDVVLIETPALDHRSKAMEWSHFADRTVAMFEAGCPIGAEGAESIAYLKNLDNFSGFVLNKVPTPAFANSRETLASPAPRPRKTKLEAV